MFDVFKSGSVLTNADFFPSEGNSETLAIYWKTAFCVFTGITRCGIPTECRGGTLIGIIASFIRASQLTTLRGPWPFGALLTEQLSIAVLVVVTSLSLVQAITLTLSADL